MKVWKKSLLMLAAILVLIAGAGITYAATVWNTTQSTLKTTFTSVGKTSTNITANKPLTVLLMGVDTGGAGRGGSDDWQGNSDSMIVLTLNPQTKTSTMVSMERDTMTNLVDANGNTVSSQKMNAAYPLGFDAGGLNTAAQWAMNTVGQQAGLTLDNFIAINMDGLVNLVNDVGGIDVNNDSGGDIFIYNTEPEYTAVVPPGKQHINGDQALVYSRDRDHLSNGDYGRIAHQREVITQLMQKMLTMNNISQYQKFLNDISKDFKTNIAVNGNNLQALLGYRDAFKKVVSIQYQGVGDSVDGVSYQFTPTQTLLAVQNAMLKSVGQSTLTALNSNLVTYESYFGLTPSGALLPSANVTENGATTTYGINADGSLVKITSNNASNYVSVDGGSVADNSTTSSSSS